MKNFLKKYGKSIGDNLNIAITAFWLVFAIGTFFAKGVKYDAVNMGLTRFLVAILMVINLVGNVMYDRLEKLCGEATNGWKEAIDGWKKSANDNAEFLEQVRNAVASHPKQEEHLRN